MHRLAGWRHVRLAVFWGLFGKSGPWLVPMVLGLLWDPESISAAPASISVSIYGIGSRVFLAGKALVEA